MIRYNRSDISLLLDVLDSFQGNRRLLFHYLDRLSVGDVGELDDLASCISDLLIKQRDLLNHFI